MDSPTPQNPLPSPPLDAYQIYCRANWAGEAKWPESESDTEEELGVFESEKLSIDSVGYCHATFMKEHEQHMKEFAALYEALEGKPLPSQLDVRKLEENSETQDISNGINEVLSFFTHFFMNFMKFFNFQLGFGLVACVK